ncbi:hypothetical protein Tco_0780450 [Tanacetum coccineum]
MKKKDKGIARDAEIPKQLPTRKNLYSKARTRNKRNEGVAETTQAHDIDWSDPAVIRYHAQQNRSFSKAEEVMKRSVFDFKEPTLLKDKRLEKFQVEEVYIEALQVYQVFEDMLKRFDRDDLEKLWDLVRKKFSSTEPTVDKEKVVVRGIEKEVSEEELKKLLVIVPVEEVYIEALQDLVKKKFSSTETTVDKEKVLWVELKRLFEPDDDDTLWKLQRYIHDPEMEIVVQIVLWIVDSGCSKHMKGDRSLLKNFIEKFMGTVRFGNDNFAAITGYILC